MTLWEIFGLAVFVASIVALHATEPRASWRDVQVIELRPNRRIK